MVCYPAVVMPFRKTVKVQFFHLPKYFVVSEKVLIEKSTLFFCNNSNYGMVLQGRGSR